MEDNQNNTNLEVIKQNEISKWWILLSSVLFIALGILFVNSPVEALASLIYYIAFAKIISGAGGIAVSIRRSKEVRKWNFAISIVDLIFGLLLLASPYLKITLIIFLPYMLAAWAFVRGILVVTSSIKNKEEYKHWWLTLISGIISVIAGCMILAFPLLSLAVSMQIFGIFMIVMGASLICQFFVLLFKKN